MISDSIADAVQALRTMFTVSPLGVQELPSAPVSSLPLDESLPPQAASVNPAITASAAIRRAVDFMVPPGSEQLASALLRLLGD
jgi:hypothetical protein